MADGETETVCGLAEHAQLILSRRVTLPPQVEGEQEDSELKEIEGFNCHPFTIWYKQCPYQVRNASRSMQLADTRAWMRSQ